MQDLTQSSLPYMKGKSKHLFWGIVAYMLLVPLLYDVVHYLLSATGDGFIYRLASSIADVLSGPWGNAIIAGIWFALLLLYGLNSNIKTYRIILIILSLTPLINVLYVLYMNNVFPALVLNGIPVGAIVGIAVPLCWVVGMLFIAIQKGTGMFLRISAILLITSNLIQLFHAIYLGISPQDAPSPILYNTQFMSRLFDISTTLFFFALSYTQPRPLYRKGPG